MNSIKFLKENKIRLNGIVYKPYLIGNLPPSFAFKEKWSTDNDGNDYAVEGINEWFNFKGFTYVSE
jgi:hypothetical protein